MINITKVVHYNVKDILRTISDIESYPKFIFWCKEIKILSRDKFNIIADVQANIGMISTSYRSHIKIDDYTDNNSDNRYASIAVIANDDGPFKYMQTLWIITELDYNTTEVNFSMNFKFKNIIKNTLSKFLIKSIVKNTISSFVDYISTSLKKKSKSTLQTIKKPEIDK
ncbi:type II toxin-antitoxin system RatA family toxin [Lyticum sinuosum]|uniref:Type II toxin-antitoxin system RatA family toxin n=1 Tax=Lyticum sinuosum TaxID=1332059 RepID=A0AAE4VLT6_9RICK|nr:type II toxin-antitoxin system RatA family toxin [Lyticum sinuosum]MDZ5761008.1 Type II toxin-antitoxin system RatA family toxin [Lyticum sinuosum]